MTNRSRHAKKIETVHWTLGQAASISLTAGSEAFTLLGAQHLPETQLRMRGEALAQLDGPIGPGLGVNLTMGVILVPEGTGTTVLWSPITDGDAPWIWWETFNLIYEELVIDVVGNPIGSAARRVVDSKAMRKVRNMEFQIVVENATLTGFGAAGAMWAFSARFLSGS